MSDETVTLYDADGNPVDVPKPESPNVRQMRERLEAAEARSKRADELEAELDQLKRGVAFRDTGLQLDELQQRALEQVHEGEWTPDALRQTAAVLWPTEQVSAAEIDTAARMQAAFTGATTPPPNGDTDMDARLAAVGSEKEFMALYEQSGRPIAP